MRSGALTRHEARATYLGRRKIQSHQRELTPLVKRMDVIERRVFTNNHSAFLCATLLMNRKRHTIPVHLDQESPQFEIVAQCFV
jgi:hypothetical protein